MISTSWSAYSHLTPSGITRGNGGGYLRYRRVNGLLAFEYRFVFGSTTTFTGAAITLGTLTAQNTPSMPVPTAWATARSGDSRYWLGTVSCGAWDSSTDTYYGGAGHVSVSSGGTELIVPAFAAGRMTSTYPFAWATDDELLIGNALEAFDN